MKEEQQMSRNLLSLDSAYIRWRTEFAPFEANCFERYVSSFACTSTI